MGDDDLLRAIDARLDRDFEREGGYRSPVRVQPQRRGTLRTLIEDRRAAGVLQPMLPTKKGGDGEEAGSQRRPILFPTTTQALTRYERGMRRPRSAAWYRAMTTRLCVASASYNAAGMVGMATRCQDRAIDCAIRARGNGGAR